ncbi:MAG: cobalt-precorrin-5B (C(1))-methyltransferase CbiD [Clostridia bacterium]|jgi:cobalt-precorrin-5B (C1)-methyltransferase|nr:cobalt-precorrin-5B (C(1))-methyltransferase CbiD [Clostridia bacterium]
MEFRRNVNGKLLRCGYTTGACAAAAAKAAGIMLLGGAPVQRVSIGTPKGVALTLDVLEICLTSDYASCAVRKDAGDDPDVTDGMLIYAQVKKSARDITIGGGAGVGRVTRPGLDQPVGEAAINSVPREMITGELCETAKRYGYMGGFSVVISIPGGEELAGRTFNPRLGIEGGLSVIGTTGIVEPMSNQAMADTVRLELRQLAAKGTRSLLITPGNYGENFARESLGLSLDDHVSCSNFIGDAIDAAVELGFTRILLVGHIGKLVKLGLGVTNTHSSFGDGRMETLLACALEAGADLSLLKGIAASVTTDTALALLEGAALLDKAMAELGERIEDCLGRRVPAGVAIGYLCFTNAPALRGVLLHSANAPELMEDWRIKK